MNQVQVLREFIAIARDEMNQARGIRDEAEGKYTSARSNFLHLEERLKVEREKTMTVAQYWQELLPGYESEFGWDEFPLNSEVGKDCKICIDTLKAAADLLVGEDLSMVGAEPTSLVQAARKLVNRYVLQ